MPELTLVSHKLCPYVQRAAISLTEKSVPFERRWIDLSDKPGWFTEIAPLGKVPVLIVDDRRTRTPIFESAAILEYLEDTQPDPLHPADAVARARHRAWIEFGSEILNGIARLYNAADAEAFAAAANKLADMFERIEGELAARQGGPWFAGRNFSLVDAVFGPIFRYFDVFDRIGDFGILNGKPEIVAWRAALAARHSVRNATVDEYPNLLRDFLLRRRSHITTLMREEATASRAR
ncbi:MAG: glutathione S-transferase family protein [Rhizobiaceae bacterium]|nr:glutathione S-transferase family protein [Rhizobiaceae bacterium]